MKRAVGAILIAFSCEAIIGLCAPHALPAWAFAVIGSGIGMSVVLLTGAGS